MHTTTMQTNKFWIENESQAQGQSSTKFIEILLNCICGPNLEILTWIGGEKWVGQAHEQGQFWVWIKFGLEGQGQSPPETIGISTKVFCFSLDQICWS